MCIYQTNNLLNYDYEVVLSHLLEVCLIRTSINWNDEIQVNHAKLRTKT